VPPACPLTNAANPGLKGGNEEASGALHGETPLLARLDSDGRNFAFAFAFAFTFVFALVCEDFSLSLSIVSVLGRLGGRIPKEALPRMLRKSSRGILLLLDAA